MQNTYSSDGCKTQHKTYYTYAKNFLEEGTNKPLNQHILHAESSNPLITEPVFLILHKDLMNAWAGK